jgi:hypothetical protein
MRSVQKPSACVHACGLPSWAPAVLPMAGRKVASPVSQKVQASDSLNEYLLSDGFSEKPPEALRRAR